MRRIDQHPCQDSAASSAAQIAGAPYPSRPLSADPADPGDRRVRDPGHAVGVLIGEDHPGAGRDLGSWIADHGYVVIDIVASEIALINAAIRHRPRLILTSTRLGDREVGVPALHAIQHFYDPAIVLATNGAGERLVGARPQHSIVIGKPYQCREVIAAIGQALVLKARTVPVRRLDDLHRGKDAGVFARADVPLFHDVKEDGACVPSPAIAAASEVFGDGTANRLRSDDMVVVDSGGRSDERQWRMTGAVRRAGLAAGHFLMARARGTGKSFARKLDKEIGETIASTLVNLALAASTPLLAMLLALPAEFGWAGPVVAALRMARSR